MIGQEIYANSNFYLDEITSLATTETVITYDMLPLHFRMKSSDITDEPMQAADFIVQPDKELLPLDQFLREAEAYYLQKAMKLNEDNVTKTANALGMSRQNLQYRLRKIKNEGKGYECLFPHFFSPSMLRLLIQIFRSSLVVCLSMS